MTNEYDRLLETDPARTDPALAKARAAAWMAFCKGLATMGNRDAGEHKHTFQSWWLCYGVHDARSAIDGAVERAENAETLGQETIDCRCKLVSQDRIAEYDQSECPTHGPNAPRYFVDHGTIHDRVTGRHVAIEEAAALLSVEPDAANRIAWGVVAEIGPRLRAADDELASLRTALAESQAECEGLRKERDEYAALFEVKSLQRSIDGARTNAEHQTAEQIAAWLESGERRIADTREHGHSEAAAIRAGAWRKETR